MPASQRAVPPFEVIREADVMVTARDGVQLATDIYRPARAGKPVEGTFPVILERTPYGKHLSSRSELDAGEQKPRSRLEIASYFVEQGYIVVYQDCRGRYGSQGKFIKYLSDGEDGFDTIDWIARQPWCDGRVATMGLSYAAHTQMAAGCLAPKAMAAMVLDCGGFSNAYRVAIRNGGAFEMKQATWAFNQARESPQAKADPVVRAALAQENLRDWFKALPWRPGQSPVRHVPEYEDYLFEQWYAGEFSEYWKQLGIYAEGWYDEFADVPQTHMSGWYDPYVPTAIGNYQAMKARKRSAMRLIMGPWMHGDRCKSWSGDVDFGSQATLDGNIAEHWREYRLRWFDHWLKGKDNGVAEEPSVRLFLMGGGSERRNADGRMDHGGCWIAGDDWPLPQTRFVPYYLHGDGRLSADLPAADALPLSYDYDPDNPVPTIGGALTSGAPVFDGGAFDQREDERFYGCTRPGLPLAARSDILVFETPPLEEDVAVIGPLKIVLHVSSNCIDTDFTAKLVDVHPGNPDYPRGYAMNLADGILRCRYRKSWEKPEFMTPGAVYEIEIEPYATCNLFKAGHRIRVDISSSNFPRYDLNYNTGEPEGRARRRRIALNTVYVDSNRASHIVLPIVPAAALRKLQP